jgi:ADP-ribose pyrophosphatase YjhB (NUDIX family)
MEIKTAITTLEGAKFDVVFRDGDPDIDLKGEDLHGASGYCFYGEKLVIVNNGKEGHWTPPGGSIEPGETYQEALVREVREESNMEVLYQKHIGYQIFTAEDGRIVRQTRSFCIVRPYGDFVSDPDGDIQEIKLINPKEYKQYFDWGMVGDEVMKRAVEIKREYDSRFAKEC